jgi:hypothetical protein
MKFKLTISATLCVLRKPSFVRQPLPKGVWRCYSSKNENNEGHIKINQDQRVPTVDIVQKNNVAKVPDPSTLNSKCGPEEEDEEDTMEEMFIMGPSGVMEWNGPTRGGKRPEPTRYGDWERKGRCSDF